MTAHTIADEHTAEVTSLETAAMVGAFRSHQEEIEAATATFNDPAFKARVRAFREERTAYYVAKLGDCELAHINAESDTHQRFKNVTYAKAVMGLFGMARTSGGSFGVKA